ncbi:hypothetical protein CLOM_g23804 [Closterium sp. NIES-68]|nr:hypothetical protein CLOM_g23804 [Closterium sp. NIES-68]GJP57929.1 hypothetical protein CLOP_g19046 [Closterium sp. NIES-67]GJP76054.1 hypothetical protein CLOP_g6445 [Closterium sp. NIES-67]
MSFIAALRHAATPVAIVAGAAISSYLVADILAGDSEARSKPRGVASSVSGWSAVEYRRMPIAEYLKILSGSEEVDGMADDRSVRAMLRRLADAPSCTSV